MSDRSVRLARARGYPYSYPGHSFVWLNDEVTEFNFKETNGRTAVLAVGSNRAPSRLAQKFLGVNDSSIPVQCAWLKDFDIVYAAQLSSYGAVPAMLQRAPGVTVELAITWLNDEQLEIMHATEGGYYYAEIEGINLTCDDGTQMDSVKLYVGCDGHLMHKQKPIALLDIRVQDRLYPAYNTAEVLQIINRRVAHDLQHDDFVLRVIEDTNFRRRCSNILARDSVPFDYPFNKL